MQPAPANNQLLIGKPLTTLFIVMLHALFGAQLLAQKKGETPYFKVSDIKYSQKAKDPRLNSLDIYIPRKGSNSPVIVWIHGGVWTFGDKSDMDYKPEYFTSRGYIFISVNHRLSPDARFPAHVQDIADAIVWIHNNLIHYSGDPSKIFLMGYASGAHLAALVSVKDHLLREAGGSLAMIKGVVLLDGVGFDMASTMPDAVSKVREWCVDTFGDSPENWADASPVTYVKAGSTAPPHLIIYAGTKSPTEKDALLLSKKLSEAGIKNKVMNYSKKSNLSINKELGKEEDKVAEDILVFLHECIR
jgi:acetyl esterase/lipase